jgi:hypothetical protein
MTALPLKEESSIQRIAGIDPLEFMAAGELHPFEYPQRKHSRRHTPPAFTDYRRFKDYLRDEFVFTCVYCLSRETWNLSASFFGVEHYNPKSIYTGEEVTYTNLLYRSAGMD